MQARYVLDFYVEHAEHSVNESLKIKLTIYIDVFFFSVIERVASGVPRVRIVMRNVYPTVNLKK